MAHKVVYNITKGSDGRTYWTKIGVAFPNRDGSLNVKLTLVPLNGELHIRDYVPNDRPPQQKPLNLDPELSPEDADDVPF